MLSNNKVAFHTLGCKLNFTETSTIARSFVKNGFHITSFNKKADFYVINTCSVTEKADKKFRNILNRAIKLNPNSIKIVVGCYAQLKPEEISNIPGVDLVLGANEKFNIVDFLPDLTSGKKIQFHSCDIEKVNNYVGSFSIDNRTRSFLKIQDGCDYKCSYCTIPLARGISRSDSIKNIKKNISKIESSKVKEVVLTGINIGDYGKGEFGNKNHKNTFYELLNELEIYGNIDRYRISSIEPNLLKNEIIDFIANSDRFAPHFHIPLQSGSNKVLGLMRRRYNRELYRERVNYIHKKIKDACIGVDVIVGFPGETDDDFLETYNFLLDLNIAYLHVFPFSERDNTHAIRMSNKVPREVKNKRSMMLRVLSEKKRRFFYQSQLNKMKNILFESENKQGYINGYTENYIKVRMPWNPSLSNQIVRGRLQKIDNEGYVRLEV